uniref:NK cell receptor 2B4 n=1 Tax=Rattus norvegicus TaxID=10116 RepID=Q9EQK9_RAT|nr:NK cell receptor 2B4 [Rattus norvegicus]
MLQQTVLLSLFLLLRAHQGQDCAGSSEEVLGVSGKPVRLRPSNIQTKHVSIEWKKKTGHQQTSHIVTWNTLDPESPVVCCSDIYGFESENFALSIKSAKLNDSGHYLLEITDQGGIVCTKNFQILIFDPVETPHLTVQGSLWANGTCQLSLSCFVPKDDNVSYALYRGSMLISNQRNGTHWENWTDASSLHTYTCNVSNKASWANHTLTSPQSCQSVPSKFNYLPFVVSIGILVTFLLGAIACFCVWNRKRKQSQSIAKESLTIYEYVKNAQVSRDQQGHFRASGSSSDVRGDEREQRESDRRLFQEQMAEQKSPEDGGAMYSKVQCKPSASTSQEKCTIYSVVEPSRKSGSKKRNQNPSLNCTVYEEIGKQWVKPQNPARLSRRELENFEAYF